MALRDEVESWSPDRSTLVNWATLVNGDPLITELGQVVDPVYTEKALEIDPYLGVSVVGTEVNLDFNNSGIKTEITTLINDITTTSEEW